MARPYDVIPYCIEQLLGLLATHTLAVPTEISNKLHSTYFRDYFQELGARTIVVEYDYIDRDFLEDFSNYYVKCFSDYRRKCTRLHFFSQTFSPENFKAILTGDHGASLKGLCDSYLGFIVVKPLPKTIIGRTCLRTYSVGTGREFPAARRYDVSLFGIELSVDTLAYQEQDQVTAACATSALWSMFHRTGLMFHHSFPTPIEITKSATLNLPAERRNLPNNGLTLEQMAHAIRNVGLEPFPVRAQNEYVLKSTIYAYLKAGVPVAMTIVLVDVSQTPHTMMYDVGHAVAVTGYCMAEEQRPSLLRTGLVTKSARIEKLYVHDDQVGPFARMAIDGIDVNVQPPQGGGLVTSISISSSWKGKDGQIGSARAIPQAVLVPLYHKIRIPYDIVDQVVIGFDSFVEAFRDLGFIPLKERLEWDIFLSTLKDFKEDMFNSTYLSAGVKEEILTTSLPRFIWRAIAYNEGVPVLELIFDATDIEQGKVFIAPIVYKMELYAILKSLINQPAIEAGVKGKAAGQILEAFK